MEPTMMLGRQTGPNSRQRGMTLVEMLIAMVVGLFLMGAMLTVFDRNKQAYRYQNGLAEVQEQGRFAISFLTENLRVAGFPGDNPPAANKIEGTDGATDTVTIRFRDNLDCLDVARLGVAVNRFRINAGNLECSGDGITWDIYVQNIEDMQILYGEDLTADGSANRYVTATQAPTWANVVIARVSLLARSADRVAEQSEDHVDLNGNIVAAQDNRLRRTFSTTITLRN